MNSKLSAQLKAMQEAIAAATGQNLAQVKAQHQEDTAAPPKAVKTAAKPAPELSGETLTEQFNAKMAEPEPEAPKKTRAAKAKPVLSRRTDYEGRPIVHDYETDDPIHIAVLHGLALANHEAIVEDLAFPSMYGLDDIAVRCVQYGNGYLIGLIQTSTGHTFGEIEYCSSDAAKIESWGAWMENIAEHVEVPAPIKAR